MKGALGSMQKLLLNGQSHTLRGKGIWWLLLTDKDKHFITLLKNSAYKRYVQVTNNKV
jgi:hypothetical protein